MTDPLSVSAGVVGLIVPALHAARLLLDDVQKIIDARAAINHLKEDLTSLDATVESLRAIEEQDWALLGDAVTTHAKAVIATCDKACRTFHADLARWTRRSRGGKLSWRDRATIGFFKESQMKAISRQLQSCKITCGNVVEVATLYSSLRNNRITQETKDALAAKETELTVFSKATDTRLADVEASLAQMQLVDVTTQDDSAVDDLMSAVAQLEEELVALKASRELVPELLARVSKEEISKLAASDRGSTTTVTFGNSNSGFLVGVNSGSIGDVKMGSVGKRAKGSR